MGASRDRVLIIARSECRASNHQVAPVLQAVEPAHDRLSHVVVDRIAFARNRARNGNLSIRFANDFGSNAVIAAVLLQSTEARSC